MVMPRATECPSGSTQAALEITATWDNSYGLDLHVIEPGGTEVNDYNTLGVSNRTIIELVDRFRVTPLSLGRGKKGDERV